MASFEQDLREKLQKSGLLERMKSLFLDAALDVVKTDSDPSRTDPRLLKPSPLLLQNRETEEFAMSMSLVVDFLRQYNLLHTLNCLKSECGPEIFPQDMEETEEEIQEERAALCEDLEISTEGTALERIYEKAMKAPVSAANNNSSTPMKTHTIAEMQSRPTAQQEKTPSPTKSEKSEQQSPSQQSAAASPSSPGQNAKSNAPADADEYQVEPVSHPNGKGKQTAYTVEWYDGGEFVRYNQIQDQPFVMEYMRNCRILIFDSVDSITMDDCENCEVVVASCQNSFFIRTCKNIKLIIACKQLRTRDCEDCDFHLFTTTDPVVENSCGMHFYPFNLESPNLIDRFQSARFDAKMNRFVHVYDFTVDAPLAKEHFTVHWPDHGNTQMQRYGMGVDEANINSPPEIRMLLEGEIEPAQSLERGAGKSLNIKTGATQWQNQNNNQNQGAAPVQQQQRPSSAPATTTAAPAQNQQQRPASATGVPKLGASGVPPITGITPTSNTQQQQQDDEDFSSSSSSEVSSPEKQQQEQAAPAPAPKPAAEEKPQDAFMLSRDSSSSSESSYSSFENSDDDDEF